jgi:FAD-dependent oxidoreductase domain-containing protein 1
MGVNRMYDVVIVGGGVMGSSVAYYLTGAHENLKVAVVERDPAYIYSSTTLSMANARIQFSLDKNVAISQYAIERLEGFQNEMSVDGTGVDIAYCQEGNLFLVDENGHEAALRGLSMQQEMGCQVAWWSPEKISKTYPLYESGGFAGGTFGAKDGHFDAYSVLMGYRKKAIAQGAVYLKDEVTSLVVDGRAISGVRLASGEDLTAGVVINCAGAWAADVAKTAGVSIPVEPVKRQVFVLDPEVKPRGPLPLTVLPSGLYFRTETGGLILLGKSMEEDPVGYDFSWDDSRFMETLWMELAEFVPAFEALKISRGWAGLYAVNRLDGNAILGEWPEVRGLFLANGFSGHGLQQAPAVGRYLMELITGKTPALDLSIFHPQRILEGRPLSESGLV